jgi:hypothetical protein
MSTSKKIELTFQTAFADLQTKDETITASELTDLINEFADRTLSDKTVRAHLRKMKMRDQSKMKNAVWQITLAIAESELAYFNRRQQADDAS